MTDINTKKNTFTEPVCNKCAKHIKGSECQAFKKIPNEILTGENKHTKPLKEQKNNIVFEPIK